MGNQRARSTVRKCLEVERLDDRILPDAAAAGQILLILREQQFLASIIRTENAVQIQVIDTGALSQSASLGSLPATVATTSPTATPTTGSDSASSTTSSDPTSVTSSNSDPNSTGPIGTDSSALATTGTSSSSATSTNSNSNSAASAGNSALAPTSTSQKPSDLSGSRTLITESNTGSSELNDALASVQVKGSDVRSMVESMPMSVASLYPFLSATVTAQAGARTVGDVDGRLPSLMTTTAETNTSSLDRVDAPVRSLKPLLRPLPAFKWFTGKEAEIAQTIAPGLAGEASPAEATMASAEIDGEFINEFAPFDPATMDERIQQFLAKLHDQPHTSDSNGRFGSLALLSVAVLGGLVGMQLVRRQKPESRKRELSTKSLHRSATRPIW
jgi:hypothetical protein